MQYLARIKPTSKREKQVIDGVAFEKRRGWYGPIGEVMAKRLRELPENDLNPVSSPKVFDVMEQAEAQAVEQAEQAVEEPAGTTETPVEAPTPPEPPAETTDETPEARRSTRGGRRSHKASDVDGESSSRRRSRG